mgnify:CR=1 FL=1
MTTTSPSFSLYKWYILVSNSCTTLYLTHPGRINTESIVKIHNDTKELENSLFKLGYLNVNNYYFDTLKIKCDAYTICKLAKSININFNFFIL